MTPEEARANIAKRLAAGDRHDAWKGFTVQGLRDRLHGLAQTLPEGARQGLQGKAANPKTGRKALIALIELREAEIRKAGGTVLP